MNVPIARAAAVLGVSEGTVRRWIAGGAPVARRGGRGRGRVTLLDPAAIEAWRASQGNAGNTEAALREFAGRIPELLGEAVYQAFQGAPDKRNGAWVAVAAWQFAVLGIFDALAEELGELPDPPVPGNVAQLRQVAKK